MPAPSVRWTRRLLHGTELSHKKPTKCVQEPHSLAQQHANAHRQIIKLCWLMDKHVVSAERVINIDDTSFRLLPVQTIRAVAAGNTRELTTFTAAFNMDRGPSDMLVPIAARWQYRRRLAGGTLGGAHVPRHIGERLGTTTTTLLQLTATLDDVMNPGMERQSWTLLWDMPSIHASEATLAAMMAAFLHVVLCFIPPRSTSYLQPCDLAVSRGFKSCIQTQASTTLARFVIDGSFDDVEMNNAWRTQSAAEWASCAVQDLREKNQVWTVGRSRLRARDTTAFGGAVSEAVALHSHDELLSMHIEKDHAEEDPVETTTSPCRTHFCPMSQTSSTSQRRQHLRLECRTWSVASLCASCTALDCVGIDLVRQSNVIMLSRVSVCSFHCGSVVSCVGRQAGSQIVTGQA